MKRRDGWLSNLFLLSAVLEVAGEANHIKSREVREEVMSPRHDH